MGIRIEQPGGAKAAATAGTMIGKADRAKEDRARAERQQAQAAQDQARQMAMQWEQQKMLLNSQQDFAHEQRLRQAQLEGEARSREWDVEKMEIRSRIDFEGEEKERRRVMDEAVTGIKAIDKYVKSGKGTETDVQQLRLGYEIQKETGKMPPNSLLQSSKPTKPKSNTEQMRELEAGMTLKGFTEQDVVDAGLNPADYPGITQPEVTPELPPAPQGKVWVKSPDGQTGLLSERELTLPQYKEYTRVDEETLNQPEEQSTEPEEETEGMGLMALYGASPLGLYGSYAGRNRQLQMAKMQKTKEARKKMTLGERLRR